MVTGFARIAKQKYPEFQVVIGDRKKGIIVDSPIFYNNPNITKSSEISLEIKKVWIENYSNNRPYIKKQNEEKFYWNMEYRPIAGDLFFKKEEVEKSNLFYKKMELIKGNKKVVFIEPSRIQKIFDKRDWGEDNWQQLISSLKEEILFIQSVHNDSKIFNDAIPFSADFRTACSMLNLCDAFIGWEGGFSHAAAALKKKAVVLFGGWIHPKTTGYFMHSNFYIDIEGSPCGVKKNCEHCNKCRDLMSVDKVIKKLKEILFI